MEISVICISYSGLGNATTSYSLHVDWLRVSALIVILLQGESILVGGLELEARGGGEFHR